ncbi:ribonuclease H-like domain-containing protein, partial [Dimargaris cristalligena]
PPRRQRVFTDGSATVNRHGNSYGGIGVYYGRNDPRNVSEPLLNGRPTSNRAELTAILRALETSNRTRPLEICTDSQSSIDTIAKWHPTWTVGGWKHPTGRRIGDADIVWNICRELASHTGPVKFTKVRAHSGNRGNDKAHRLAAKGSQ